MLSTFQQIPRSITDVQYIENQGVICFSHRKYKVYDLAQNLHFIISTISYWLEKVFLSNICVLGMGEWRDYTKHEYLESRITEGWLLLTESEYTNLGSGTIKLGELVEAR